MELQPCIFLGIKLAPGPIERHKIENFGLDNTVDHLKSEAEKKTNVPSASLVLIHHGKILKNGATLQDSGIKNGEMVHVVKKKEQLPPEAPQTYSDAELQQILTSLRTFGCTPNAPGWTRAMQMLNDEATMAEIIEAVPSLGEDCVSLSILHEVELIAALGASLQTMRRAANARPDLPVALRQLTRLVQSRSNTAAANLDNAPTSGFAYSLEALSEDEEGDEEEEPESERNIITQEHLLAALQAATEAVSSNPTSRVGSSHTAQSLSRLLQGSPTRGNTSNSAGTPTSSGGSNQMITSEMFQEAITEAMNRSGSANPDTPMEQSTNPSSSASPQLCTAERYIEEMRRMQEIGLTDDALNLRALLICSGDVNAAINLVFSGAIGDTDL